MKFRIGLACAASALFLFAVTACSGLFAPLATGSVTVALPGSSSGSARSAADGVNITDAIARYDLTLTQGDTTKTASGSSGTTITVSDLAAGTWTITGQALTSAGVCIAYGSATAQVVAGQNADATLTLTFNSLNSLASIAVTKSPAKTSYTLGDTVTAADLSGIEVTATFKSGWSCILDTNEYTVTPAAGTVITADTVCTVTAAGTAITATVPLTINIDTPAFTTKASAYSSTKTLSSSGSAISSSATSATMQISAQYLSGDQVTAVWYKASSENGSGTAIDDSAIINSNGTGSTAAGEYETITSKLTYDISTAGTSYYYCIVTVSRNGLTGTSSAQTVSDRARIEITTATINDFTVTFKNDGTTEAHDYLTPGTQPTFAMMTITETWSDGVARSASEADYTFTLPSGWTDSCVGAPEVTITRVGTDTPKTCSVTYKYTMTATTFGTASAVSEAQYTGTKTLSLATVKSGCTLYFAGTATAGYDKASYQWYKSANADLSSPEAVGDAITGTDTASSDTVTCTPGVTTAGTCYYYCVATTTSGTATYCTNSVASLTSQSATIAVTVTPWMLSLTDTNTEVTQSVENGGSVQIVAGDSYSMKFTNAYADSTSLSLANTATVSWASTSNPTITPTHDDTNGGWTFTAPAATTSAQTVTLTSSATAITNVTSFGAFTVTVPAKEATTITDFTSLSTALASGGAVSVSGTITMTGGLTVSADTVITVPSGQTATLIRDSTAASVALFTVSSGKSLTLCGSSSGTLTIDGGGKATTPVSATASLITTTGGTVIINENAVLQNNVFSSSSSNSYGGAIYAGASSTVTIAGGTVQNNDLSAKSSSLGGGVYVKKGSFSMTSGTISGNKSEKEGGGLYVEGASGSLAPLSITGGSITSNTAGADTTSQTSNGGGGIYAYYATVNITGTSDKSITISDNTTDGYGGGIHFSTGATGTVSYGTIKSNTAISRGGGVYTAGDSSITLTSCSIQNNTCSGTAGYGGGLCDDASSGTTTLTGGSVTGNSATNGAGISVNAMAAQLVITGTSISGNTKGDAGSGSSIYDYGKLSIGGAFMIASGNDLYFSTSNATAIAITGTLTTATSGSPITLTLPSYVSGISVFTAGTGVTLSDEISKFALADTSSVKLGTDGSTATK